MIFARIPAALLFATSLAASAQGTPSSPSLTGRWIVSLDLYGTPIYSELQLEQKGEELSGVLRGSKLAGKVSGASVHLLAKEEDGTTDTIEATLAKGVLSGTVVRTDPADPAHASTSAFTASLAASLVRSTPRRHDFVPSVFYRQFSPFNKPVLTVAPGDIIHTTTVDAGGQDEHGNSRVAGGNPQTGPFYIQGAQPGDTLVVHILHLKLNRDWAMSDDGLDERATNSDLAVRLRDNNKTIRWHPDLAKGLASPDKPGDHMRNFSIPVHPMLGCIATAPGPAQAPPGTGDSGNWGGNMDFNEITEGTTVLLPVANPGALLYFGDGHALQGDGELNGNALETSMDVELSVDVIPRKRIQDRRIETPDAIIAMGLDGSIDGAFKEATDNMAQWLEEDYKLTPSEVAQFLGVAAQYRISEVADRNAGIVLRISKDRLKGLTPAAPK